LKAGEGRINFFVITTEATYKKELVHKIKLSLEPLVLLNSRKLRVEEYKGQPIYASPFTIEDFERAEEG